MRSTTVRRGLGVSLLAVAMLVFTLGGLAAAQADDQTYPTVSTTPTSVGGTAVTLSRGGDPGGASLPFTGGDVALLTVLGLGAVGAGVGIVVFTRRRSTSAA